MIILDFTLEPINPTLTGGINAFYREDIENNLTDYQMEDFNRHFNGKTMMIANDGRIAVYAWDWDEFVRIYRKRFAILR